MLQRHAKSAPGSGPESVARCGVISTVLPGGVGHIRHRPAERRPIGAPSAPDAASQPAISRIRKWFRGRMLNRANASGRTPGRTPFWGWHGSFIRSGSLAGEPTSRRTVRRPLDQQAHHMWSCREAGRAQRALNSPDSVRADSRCPRRGRAPARDPSSGLVGQGGSNEGSVQDALEGRLRAGHH